MGFLLLTTGITEMNATTIERLPESKRRQENQLELLSRVYEDAGLTSETAEEAARADLIALYASPLNLD